jgi:hypothetical protein
MKRRAERLETAGKGACLIGFVLAVLVGAAHSGILLAASVVFLGPDFLMPGYVDLLRTRAVLAEVRSRNRAVSAVTSTPPPPQAVDPVIVHDPAPDRDGGNGWVKPLVEFAEWGFPSRTIH